MAPDSQETYDLYCKSNGNRATLGAEAAGIAACLMTYSHLSFVTARVTWQSITTAFATTHFAPESRDILNLTD
jgi:hypothetical protein